jgi:hypothetical protein
MPQDPADDSVAISDLDAFSQSFASELDLRSSLADLFRRVPNIEDVRLLHGSQEFGKDIVFSVSGPLGERRRYACVVKNDKITGKVGSSLGARTVVEQASQAFDTPYVGDKGQLEHIDSVYIITPFECAQSTMNAIKGKLLERYGNITFICGSALLELYAKYWPEFIQFHSGLLTGYLSQLTSSLSSDSSLANLITQYSLLSPEQKPFRSVYVEPMFRQELSVFSLSVPMWERNAISHRSDKAQHTLPELEPFVVARREVERFLRKLDQVGKIAELTSLWAETKPAMEADWRLRAQKIPAFRKNLRLAWKKSVSAARAQCRTASDSLLIDFDPSVPFIMGAAFKSEYCAMHVFADEVTENLASVLSKANVFARHEHMNAQEAVCHPAYRQYCSVEELSRIVPQMLYRESRLIVPFAPEFLATGLPAVLVTAPAGYGKTSFCKWHLLKDAEDFISGRRDVVPVLIPLHQLTYGALDSVASAFFRNPQLARLTDNGKDISNIPCKLRLYLDGLDEIASVERQEKVVLLAKMCLEKLPGAQVIITSRDYVSGAWLGWMPRVQLNEFSEQNTAEFVANWLGQDITEISEFTRQLDLAPQLHALMRVPLLATLILAVFRNRRALPENRAKLYDMFVELLSGGWDNVKGVRRTSDYGPALKISILCCYAGILHLSRRRDGTLDDFVLSVGTVAGNLAERADSLLREILEDGLLVKNGSHYLFPHLSFQEFLAAKELSDPMGKNHTGALEDYLHGDGWWSEPLFFYIAQSNTPQNIERWINRTASSLYQRERRREIQDRVNLLKQKIYDSYPGYLSKSEDPESDSYVDD